MATYQTTYSEAAPFGVAGAIVNSETYNKISRTLESATLNFGIPVVRGAAEHGCAKLGTETLAAVAAAVGGNTGNGTMSAVTAAALTKKGVWTLTVIAAATNAGTFTLEDPDGNTIDTGTVGAAWNKAGLGFTLNDGAADFAVGDQFTITVSGSPASGNILGLSVRDTTLGAEKENYTQYDSVAIMDEGVMWVTAGATVTANQPVYWDPSTEKYTSTVTHIRIPQCEFDTGGALNALVRVRLRKIPA